MSTSYDFDLNKKGDKIERLTSKFDHNRNEKSDRFVRSVTLPLHTHKDMSSLKRQWSQNTEDQPTNKTDISEQKSINRPKVTERWIHNTQSLVEAKTERSEIRTRPISTSLVESNKVTRSEISTRPISTSSVESYKVRFIFRNNLIKIEHHILQ